MSYAEWQAHYRRVWDAIARIDRLRWERVNAECQANGLDVACLHNAALDDALRGWCYRNPVRLKVAKRLDREMKDFSHYRLAESATRRAWSRVERV